jgi:hypothetical protein
MNPTPLLAFTLDKVKLAQGDSLEPFLVFVLNVKFRSNGNNRGIDSITLLETKTKIFVSTSTSRFEGQEIGLAQTWQPTNLKEIGSDSNVELIMPLSPYLLNKIENLRGGGDLFFFTYAQLSAYGAVVRNDQATTEVIWINADQERERFKYSRSEWTDDLNATDAKTMLFEIPSVSLPDLPLTAEVTRFLGEAERALKDGRSGDVFGECRKALNALYNGIDVWGATQKLTKEEEAQIQKAQTDKVSLQRNIYFSRLAGHPEKGERFNKLRNSLYQYLSLAPHEAEYKEITFSRDDAMFVLRTTYGLMAHTLHNMTHHARA